MRVLILVNEPILPQGHPDAESERDVLATADAVGRHLAESGFTVSRLSVGRDPAVLLEGLRAHRPDAVFNLFEGLADAGDTEAAVAGLMEWLGIPFTGCPSRAMVLGRSKPLAKTLLQGAGLPTPGFFVVDRLPVADCPLRWPVIVKPAAQDASVGLDQGSVVTDLDRLNERTALLLERYGPPVLVEQFIAGREIYAALIEDPELRVLPLSEVMFRSEDPASWRILTYDAKWKPETREYQETMPSYATRIAPRLAERIRQLATRAFHLLGCRDYARVDFRVGPGGKPFVLEVNPNPDLGPSAGLATGLAAAGLVYSQFVVDLVRKALARGSTGATRSSGS